MRLHTILFVIICLPFQALYAQTSDSIAIARTFDRRGYYYIPKSALADSIQGICHQIMTHSKSNRKIKPLEFTWNSTCNDGYYSLSITPEQIFFSSSHDNPNPNFLFWVIDIKNSQFEQISNGLRKSPPKGFTNASKYYGSLTVYKEDLFRDEFPLPDEWSDSIMKQHDLYCEAQIKSQLDKYFSILNSHISTVEHKVSIPVVKMAPKYFGFSESEIRGWIPVKLVRPNLAID